MSDIINDSTANTGATADLTGFTDIGRATGQIPTLVGPAHVFVEKTRIDELESKAAKVDDLTARLETATQSLDYLRSKITRMSDDWNKLNGFLNDYATDEGMCDGYEDKLAEWNAEFGELKLEGRVKKFEVSVKVDLTYYTTLEVEARSEDDARDQVNDMDIDDILDNVELKYHDDHEWDATDVQVAS